MTAQPRPITPEDLLAFKEVGDVQISPDGALIAFVVADSFKTDTSAPRSQIWVVPAAGGAARPWTTGPRADTAPRWSPDGRTLAFLSDREDDGTPQIYLLDRDGGEARRLTNQPCAVVEIAWSPDGTRIAFLMDDPESDEERTRREESGGAIEVEKLHRWRRVWTVDVATGATRQITGEMQVWEFAWAPDGGLVLVTGAEPYEWSWFEPCLYAVGPEGGPARLLYRTPEKGLACPRVSPDGQQVAFLSAIWSDRGINGGDVLLVPRGGGPARTLTAGYGGSIWWINWAADSAALDFLAYENGEATIGRLDAATGQRAVRWRGPAAFDEHFSAAHIAADGTFAAIRSDAAHPPEVWLATATDHRRPTTDGRPPQSEDAAGAAPDAHRAIGAWRQLTGVQPPIDRFALGETRVLHWRSDDGLEIQGLLILPPGYREGERLPLVTWVHGGPAWLYVQGFYASGWRMQQALAGAGFAVLLPNPRGSVGWGVAFTEANIGDFGGRDFADIMAGVDHVVALGIADPQRLGIGGWSYGGFMSAWAITQTDRFRAAVVGAAITHWRSFHGEASIGAWDRVSLRASPYEQGGIYDRRSPIHFVANVRTPALIIHGQDDSIVPVGQSYEFFRALKDHGVPAELVVYPREGHAIRERAHQLDRFRRYLQWFQRYLSPADD
jgi:dipeptidyl aminopeptidase/acylaminoacyl peptidase